MAARCLFLVFLIFVLLQPSVTGNHTVIREGDPVQLSGKTLDGYNFTDLLGDLIIIDPTTEQTSSTAGLTSPLTSTATTSGFTSSLIPNTAVNPTPGVSVSSILTTGIPQSSTEGGPNSTNGVVVLHLRKSLVKLLWLAAVGVGSGVGMFLVGWTAAYCCRKTKISTSQRPQAQQDEHNQHLVMETKSSGGMVDSGDDGFYSVILSVPPTIMSSDPVGENGPSSENDTIDTYHVYCSIPDRPAASAQTDYTTRFL